MKILDECFYFKTLTRKIKAKWGVRRRLVTLKIKGLTQSDIPAMELRGLWYLRGRSIALWTRGKEGIFPIEEVMSTLIHESVHSFLGLFADKHHPRHRERVALNGGHGPIFAELFYSIGKQVGEITGSRIWQEQRWSEDRYGTGLHPPLHPSGGGFAPSSLPYHNYPPSNHSSRRPPPREPSGGSFAPGSFPRGNQPHRPRHRDPPPRDFPRSVPRNGPPRDSPRDSRPPFGLGFHPFHRDSPRGFPPDFPRLRPRDFPPGFFDDYDDFEGFDEHGPRDFMF
ncbi:hypothetical protein F5X97DRAFT_301343 [Nemania serpens]|nr:hypothetical protein F5X97DRAFT_301343 [Nemania serpens]